MNNYIQYINKKINEVCLNKKNLLFYGENINNGSKISGLSRGIELSDENLILNVGNCEYTHCGVGFGIMMDGNNSVLFSKQLDFILLGMDQIYNTYNFIKAFYNKDKIGSFTIFVIVVDQGYQGPHSSFNNPGDFASICDIPVYCLNSKFDIDEVISNHFISNGFRIITVSAKKFSENLEIYEPQSIYDKNSKFKYMDGNDLTILSTNFTLNTAMELAKNLKQKNIFSDLFFLNYIKNNNFDFIEKSINKTERLLVFDDSKGFNKFTDAIITSLKEKNIKFKFKTFYRRGQEDNSHKVNSDIYEPKGLDSLDEFLKK